MYRYYYAGSRTDFWTTFPKLFSWTSFQEWDFKFCLTWYLTDTTLCLWSGFNHPDLEYLIEKRFHGLFSKRKPLKSRSWRIVPGKSFGKLLLEQNFPDEITGITWKTNKNLEKWPFLKSDSQFSLRESAPKIGCFYTLRIPRDRLNTAALRD